MASEEMTLTADILRRAQLIVPKRDVRYYLTYVKVEKHPVKGAVLISTDGHRLLVLRDADAENVSAALIRIESALLKRKAPQKVKAGKLSSFIAPRVRFTNDCGKSENGIAEMIDQDGDRYGAGFVEFCDFAKFPNWRGILPKEVKPTSRVSMNAQYLAAACDALTTKRDPGVNVYGQGNTTSPFLVMPSSREIHGMMVIMPMRLDDIEDPLKTEGYKDLVRETA